MPVTARKTRLVCGARGVKLFDLEQPFQKPTLSFCNLVFTPFWTGGDHEGEPRVEGERTFVVTNLEGIEG